MPGRAPRLFNPQKFADFDHGDPDESGYFVGPWAPAAIPGSFGEHHDDKNPRQASDSASAARSRLNIFVGGMAGGLNVLLTGGRLGRRVWEAVVGAKSPSITNLGQWEFSNQNDQT